MTDQPATENPLNDEQMARSAALGIAREVLKKSNGFAITPPDGFDLVRISRYILTGSEDEPIPSSEALPRVYIGDANYVQIHDFALNDGVVVLPGRSPDDSVEAADVQEPQGYGVTPDGSVDAASYGDTSEHDLAVANALVDAIKIEVERVMGGSIPRIRQRRILDAIEAARPPAPPKPEPTLLQAINAAADAIKNGQTNLVRRSLVEMGVLDKVSNLRPDEFAEFIDRLNGTHRYPGTDSMPFDDDL